jgi:Cu+-exporting ATPase
MHRQLSYADSAFQRESNLSLYALTALVGLLVGLDLWPFVATWVDPPQSWLPAWPNEVNGYRLFALAAAVLGGARALYGSLERLWEGRVGADLAIAIATVAAILAREPLVAAEIVFVGLVGECLESFTFERTQRAIRGIVEICPRRCWLLRDGQEVRVLVSELQVGDRVVVKPGGRVPADGVVIDGRSAVDASALTGESLPLDKGPGDEVLAGSLNQFGALTVEARRVAEQTVVGRVIELTARALKDKAPLERTADRLARYFLPVVLGLAAATFLVALFANWSALVQASASERMEVLRAVLRPALAVLVVACPCALILATPAAILAALGRLAGTGVLIKGGSALERLAEVRAVAFDKTGTLTEGRLELGDVLALNGVAAEDVLRVAAAAEQRSEHPIARLLAQESAGRGWTMEPVTEFEAHPGAGVAAAHGSMRVLVGTRRLLEENGVSLTAELIALLETLDASGQTALLVARDGLVLGAIGVRDRIRPEAASVLNELRSLGISDIALLTGDRAAAAGAVAAALEISEVRAEFLPEQKAAFLQEWRRQRQTKVAMVGDGINDAPALAGADVGLAIAASGADVAAEAGDVVFMGDPLRPLPLLVRLSRETVRIIRQNIIVFAFGVNALGILVTAWLWPVLAPRSWQSYAPLAAVVYHQIGSLAVLLNSMRLLWFAPAARSPARLAWESRLQRIDLWIENHLDMGEGLHWLGHHWRAALAGAAGAAAVVYALSGLTQVGPDEVAVVRRFGHPLNDDLGPGLHWRWPWPVEEITRLRPDRVHLVEVGFRSMPGRASGPAALGWSSPHAGDGISRYPEEAVLMTGDGNLVEVQATVRYTIRDPRAFLFGVRDPDALVRSAAESVLREIVAAVPFAELLTSSRASLQRDAAARLVQRCQDAGPDGLGIRLEGVSIHDLHPPQEVVRAYHDVTRAMERRDLQVNDARALAFRTERDAEAKRQEIVRQAHAAAREQVTLAEALRDAFLTRRQARVSLSLEEELKWLASAMDWIGWGGNYDEVWRAYDAARKAAIARQTAVADFRLFWDALGAALKDRDKILIDTDKMPGHRQLLLFDPKDFSPPLLGPPTAAPKGEGH